MEQQAKHRLTGGVILVVLLVLLVPELLTGPRAVLSPAPGQPDQAPMRSYTMDLGESPHLNGAPVAPSTTAPPAREATLPVNSAPPPPAAAAAISAPEPASPGVPVAAARPAAERPAGAPARARAPSSTPPSAHAAEHGTAIWTVQLATFSKRENAAHLLADLKSHGFTGSISEAARNGHNLFRVRVGAERDRAGAQKLLGRLRAAGEKGGQVVPR